MPQSDFISQFSMSSTIWRFMILISVWENICYWHFLITSIFEALCFLKLCQIFDVSLESKWKSDQESIYLELIFQHKSAPCPQNSTTEVTLKCLVFYAKKDNCEKNKMESIGEDTPLKSEALREVSPYEPPLPESKGPSRFRYIFVVFKFSIILQK